MSRKQYGKRGKKLVTEFSQFAIMFSEGKARDFVEKGYCQLFLSSLMSCLSLHWMTSMYTCFCMDIK